MSLWRYGWWLDGHPAASGVFVTSQAVITAGKYYWEVTITSGGADGTSGYGILLGVCSRAMVLTGTVATAINLAQPNSQYGAFINTRANNPIESANGWGYPARAGGIAVEIMGAPPGVYGVAINTITHKVWWRNITDNSPAGFWGGGGNSGDPVTGAEGADISASGPSPVLGNVYAMVGASHGAAAAKGAGSINFGASAFTGAVPTGYVSIESVFPGANLNSADNSNISLSGSNLVFDGTNVPVTFSPAISGFTSNVGFSNSVRSRFCIAQA